MSFGDDAMMHFLPDLDMERVEAPEVDENDDVAPEVPEHLGDDPECPGEGAGEAVLVLVHDHEALHLLHLVTQHVHQLLHKLGVSLVLK